MQDVRHTTHASAGPPPETEPRYQVVIVELVLPLHGPGVELAKQADVHIQEHLHICGDACHSEVSCCCILCSQKRSPRVGEPKSALFVFPGEPAAYNYGLR